MPGPLPTVAELLSRIDFAAGTTLLVPDDPRPGSWVGGPSAVVDGETIVLAYRMRRPVGEGRGFANVIAVSEDGETPRTVAVIDRERHDCDSLERPCLVRTPEGRWRLYISCATVGSKHWRVDLLEADTLEGLPDAPPRTVLAGDPAVVAVKDPVIRWVPGADEAGAAGKAGAAGRASAAGRAAAAGSAAAAEGAAAAGSAGLADIAGHVVSAGEQSGTWHLWASCHPLDDPDATDRMTVDHATSTDGIDWTWQGTVLTGTAGTWDARGVRPAALLDVADGLLMFYDGRASAAENWEERTGAALSAGVDGIFRPVAAAPVFVSPEGSGGLRYLTAVTDPGSGRTRIFYESARTDGGHELRTQLL
ncbi:hypothetical protein GIS00_17980 [Nakamurella sp. YIM 132087]|uniref:Exo-alpha-sialidase n=1 Tax=Nakamurella alba TaxID=2665158 RepID=A0A7K1FNT0_9ACTN|nr:hypothetical protein [Nakamurella alba]MTD15827.1 hypothetical protein [Nakamurella alba]